MPGRMGNQKTTTLNLHVVQADAERELLLEYMNTQRFANGEVEDSPFDPDDPGHLDERLRGLLYILAQHPTFLFC